MVATEHFALAILCLILSKVVVFLGFFFLFTRPLVAYSSSMWCLQSKEVSKVVLEWLCLPA